MLDIKFIRENPDKVKNGCRKKQVQVDIDRLLLLDKKRKTYLKEIEDLRAKKKKLGKENIEKAKEVKVLIKKAEPELKEVEKEFNELMLLVPNIPLDEVPEGKDESENVVL